MIQIWYKMYGLKIRINKKSQPGLLEETEVPLSFSKLSLLTDGQKINGTND